MSLLAGKVQPKLQEGTYKATLISFSETKTDKDVEYVKFNMVLESGREVSTNLFEIGFKIAMTDIANQLFGELTEEKAYDEILEAATGTQIDIWVVYNITDTGTYRNIQFKAPRPKAELPEVMPAIDASLAY